MGSRFSLLSMENSKSLQHRTSEHQPGKECWQTPLVEASYEKPTLREIRWPEVIWEAPAILEEPIYCTRRGAYLKAGILLYAHATRGASAPTPRPPRFRLFWRCSLCRLWQLYGVSLFDDGCLRPCPHLRPFVDWAGWPLITNPYQPGCEQNLARNE